MFPVDKKASSTQKFFLNNVLIPWYPISYLTIASSVFFLGAYGSLPDAAIWWCLRTGGGGVETSQNVKFDILPAKKLGVYSGVSKFSYV